MEWSGLAFNQSLIVTRAMMLRAGDNCLAYKSLPFSIGLMLIMVSRFEVRQLLTLTSTWRPSYS